MAARVVRARLLPRVVRLTWSDSHESSFHHAWLRDHCLQSRHPVSHQRELSLVDVHPGVAPADIALCNSTGGQELRVTWSAAAETSGVEHLSSFPVEWLRSHCYTKLAPWEPAKVESLRTSAVLWDGETREQHSIVPWSELDQGGSSGRTHLRELLESLHRFGVTRVSGVPGTVAATEQLARMIGPVQETFYGAPSPLVPRRLGSEPSALGRRGAERG